MKPALRSSPLSSSFSSPACSLLRMLLDLLLLLLLLLLGSQGTLGSLTTSLCHPRNGGGGGGGGDRTPNNREPLLDEKESDRSDITDPSFPFEYHQSMAMIGGEGGNWYPSIDYILPTCHWDQANTRGRYTAHLAPCQFTFHQITTTTTSSSSSGSSSTGGGGGVLLDNGDALHLSNLCTDANRLSIEATKKSNATTTTTKNLTKNFVLNEYISNWADECVGDFRRCYSLKRDQAVFLPAICARGWDIPHGTTHIAVNCTKDKKLKQMRIDQISIRNDQDREADSLEDERHIYQDKLDHKWLEVELVVAGMVGLFLLACLCFSILACKYIVQPNLKLTRHHHQGQQYHHASGRASMTEGNTLMTAATRRRISEDDTYNLDDDDDDELENDDDVEKLY